MGYIYYNVSSNKVYACTCSYMYQLYPHTYWVMVFKASLELSVVWSLGYPGDGQERMLAVLHVLLHGSMFSRAIARH